MDDKKDVRKDKIEELARELYDMNCALRDVQSKYKKRRAEIVREMELYFDNRGLSEINVEYKKEDMVPLNLRIARVMTKKVTYKTDKLEEKIERSVLDRFLERTYVIKSWKSVVRLLKKYNVPAKEFISLVEVRKEVNESKLEQLEATGEINFDMIKGCYIVDFLNSYIRLFYSRKKEK